MPRVDHVSVTRLSEQVTATLQPRFTLVGEENHRILLLLYLVSARGLRLGQLSQNETLKARMTAAQSGFSIFDLYLYSSQIQTLSGSVL